MALYNIEEKQKWFNETFIPIKRGPMGDCSSCVFRNTRNLCLKLTCWYLDIYNMNTFSWTSKLRMTNGVIPEDVYNFFNTTDKETIKEISLNAIKQALIKKNNVK